MFPGCSGQLLGVYWLMGKQDACGICGDRGHNSVEHVQMLELLSARMSSKANDRQVAGDHYKTGGKQHWDMVAEFELDYFQGQITKYLFRWRKKNGIEDLEKARHYLDKYIELERSKRDAEDQSGKGFNGDAKGV